MKRIFKPLILAAMMAVTAIVAQAADYTIGLQPTQMKMMRIMMALLCSKTTWRALQTAPLLSNYS